MADELKLCPFCGGETVHVKSVQMGRAYYTWMECETCHAAGPAVNVSGAPAAMWNTRPIEDVLRAALERVDGIEDGTYTKREEGK